jgi:hypothetical protein
MSESQAVGLMATEHSVSQRNIDAMGPVVIWRRQRYRFDPSDPAAGKLP